MIAVGRRSWEYRSFIIRYMIESFFQATVIQVGHSLETYLINSLAHAYLDGVTMSPNGPHGRIYQKRATCLFRRRTR